MNESEMNESEGLTGVVKALQEVGMDTNEEKKIDNNEPYEETSRNGDVSRVTNTDVSDDEDQDETTSDQNDKNPEMNDSDSENEDEDETTAEMDVTDLPVQTDDEYVNEDEDEHAKLLDVEKKFADMVKKLTTQQNTSATYKLMNPFCKEFFELAKSIYEKSSSWKQQAYRKAGNLKFSKELLNTKNETCKQLQGDILKAADHSDVIIANLKAQLENCEEALAHAQTVSSKTETPALAQAHETINDLKKKLDRLQKQNDDLLLKVQAMAQAASSQITIQALDVSTQASTTVQADSSIIVDQAVSENQDNDPNGYKLFMTNFNKPDYTAISVKDAVIKYVTLGLEGAKVKATFNLKFEYFKLLLNGGLTWSNVHMYVKEYKEYKGSSKIKAIFACKTNRKSKCACKATSLDIDLNGMTSEQIDGVFKVLPDKRICIPARS